MNDTDASDVLNVIETMILDSTPRLEVIFGECDYVLERTAEFIVLPQCDIKLKFTLSPSQMDDLRAGMTKDRMSMCMSGFENHMIDKGISQDARDFYIQDVRLFARWFREVNGAKLTDSNFLSIDTGLYKSNLQKDGMEASIIDRRLDALQEYADFLGQSKG
jgi:site-specific recombinase XerD